MTQIQVSLPNGAVKCVLGPPGAGEQAGGSSAAFAGAPAATAGPSLDFLMGLLLRDGPAGSILEASLCLRRSSSNDLIRSDGARGPPAGGMRLELGLAVALWGPSSVSSGSRRAVDASMAQEGRRMKTTRRELSHT